MNNRWSAFWIKRGAHWLRLVLLGGYLLTLLWRIVLPDVTRTISETRKAYARWGTVRGSGVWRGSDVQAEAIERAASFLRPGDRLMVWTGVEFEKIPDWRNLGAMAGWFLPRSVTLISGNDPAQVGANVVLSDDTLGQPPLPDDWQCVYHEWAASLYRLMPGSGPDQGKYFRSIGDVPLPSVSAWPPLKQVASRLALIFAACMVWLVAGWLMLRGISAPWLRGVARGAVALITGALACSILTLVWLLLRMPVEWQPFGISVLLLGGGWWIGCVLHPKESRVPLTGSDRVWHTVLLLSWLVYACCGAWVTLSTDANSAPDLGHYGFKALTFFCEGRVPADFPGSEAWRLHAPSYPLGGAMMLEWLFSWMGAADIHLGRVTQGLWLGAAGVLVAAWLRGRRLPSVMAWGIGFLPLGTSGSLFYLTEFYQEALLNVALLPGLFLIVDSMENHSPEQAHRIWAGALLVSACAWIKADGLLIWLAIPPLWIFLVGRGYRRLALTALTSSAVLCIVPWRLWLAVSDVGLGDFSWSAMAGRNLRENVEVLATVGRRLLEMMNLHGGTYAWWWWVVLAALVLRGRAWWNQRGLPLMLLAGATFMAAFCAVYLCSTVPLEWHMNSLYRLLSILQPWMLAWAAALAINTENVRL